MSKAPFDWMEPRRSPDRGKIEKARVLRSIPMLDPAAIDSVRQWEFQPTLLNGVPTPVVMTVTGASLGA